jgi:hypothetical protein
VLVFEETCPTIITGLPQKVLDFPQKSRGAIALHMSAFGGNSGQYSETWDQTFCGRDDEGVAV